MTETDEQIVIVLKFSGKDREFVSIVEHRMWCYMIKLHNRYDAIWLCHMIKCDVRDWWYGHVMI